MITGALQDPSLFRLLLVISVALAFAVYTRFHLVGGGSVTGGYVAILIVTSQWSTLLGTALATGLTVSLMRGVVLRLLGLPRSWQFMLSVLSGALITATLAAIIPPWIDLGDPFALAITFGAFVVPGLVSYDVSHQGLPKTLLALSMVAGATLALCVPMFLLLSLLPTAVPPSSAIVEGIPQDLMPYAIIATIVVGAVLRFTLGLRSGGFIGALFLVEFFTVPAFLAVGAAALTTHGLVWLLDRRIVLTLRQRAMIALMVGSLVAWAGLYWGSALGWLPAQEADLFVLSPLLATGLIAADMGREGSDALRTLLGTGLACVVIAGLLWLGEEHGLAWAALALLAVATGVIPGALSLREAWAAAERSGRERLVASGRDRGPSTAAS